MSKTPRTDEQELAYVAEDGSTYVHTTFARKLEREIRQLEVAVYDGKKEAAELRKMLAEMHEVNAELHKEIAELQNVG
jgi:predicted  nucleic acid-binding Zn-ribbon protein